MLQPLGAEAAKVTEPLKRLTSFTRMMEVPCVPETMLKLEGEAYMLKSGFRVCIVNVAKWVSEPLDAVTVTVYVPLVVPDGTETVIRVVLLPP